MARCPCPVFRFPVPLMREPEFQKLRRHLIESGCQLDALPGTPVVGGMWPVDGSLARTPAPAPRPRLRLIP